MVALHLRRSVGALRRADPGAALSMHRITRRDFLNGVALTIASGLTPAAQLAADPSRYPPALTGLRGQHPGAFEVAHEVGRAGRRYPVDTAPIEETYDLVVIGGGISGLAAAWFWRRDAPADARILVLDNHDDFGGHAKRNEFTLDGRLILGYGGSQSIQSPRSLWSDVAKGLIRELGVDVARFETAFDRGLYASLGLSRGVFFAREAFGRDVLVRGDPMRAFTFDPAAPDSAQPIHDLIDAFPVSAASKAALVGLYDRTRDPLAGRSAAEKRHVLKTTSYRDYLMRHCGLSAEAADSFQGRTLGFFGLGCDAVPAADVRDSGYPGFAGLGLPAEDHPEWSEPYIYHFPDGNASLARLLVRSLVPDIAPGNTMDDVVQARFDYDALDRPGQNVRIRLDSTCVEVRDGGDAVSIGYVRDGARCIVSRRAMSCSPAFT
jgi:spermidine dehydrogenase